ncbi:hypothetical protein DKX38_018301 [Salix brachista]|uniref:CCT domain-containing protein n=1 Tax=Salix brachista TaxID=2182728 RepID=A0A5N5KMS3_9ROSI|nr:hypothetical protein DKX38_018301 [Salix brachista]
MYEELLFHHMPNFFQDVQQLEEYCKYQKTNVPMSGVLVFVYFDLLFALYSNLLCLVSEKMGSNLLQTTISEYDLGGEGDLFEAPKPIIEEPLLGIDPMTAAISMISCGEEVITSQGLKVTDIESIQNEQLLNEVFYECKKDLLEKEAMDTSSLAEILDIKLPIARTDENPIKENKLLPDAALSKSVSSGCLSSIEWVHGAAGNPGFLDFPGIDFENAYGMRRAYSEGDIKTLGNGNTSLICSHLDRPLIINCSAEDRQEKLSRYRNKKTKRNFGRKIKYACRKALADSQPRIRGRFAKTEEWDVSKRQ